MSYRIKNIIKDLKQGKNNNIDENLVNTSLESINEYNLEELLKAIPLVLNNNETARGIIFKQVQAHLKQNDYTEQEFNNTLKEFFNVEIKSAEKI